MRNCLIVFLTLAFLAALTPLWAQDPATVAPPHIQLVDGAATLEREGQIETATAAEPIADGDRLRTEAGRIEVLFADGTALYLDHDTTVDVLSTSLLRLMDGRLALIVSSAATAADRSPRYQIDAPAGSVRIDTAGEYHVSHLTGGDVPDLELAVFRGAAQLVTQASAVMVRAGERSVASHDQAPDAPLAFNSARWDAFDRWIRQRHDSRAGTLSSQYLPPEVRMYAGTFDRYGTWGQVPSYGYVWYPTAAAPGWRPYFNGHWNFIGRFGWTWIGFDSWAWPTHHFGRWGFSNGVWFWIPARRWAPAWVAWSIAPGFVGWCPLGFDGRPVVGFWGQKFAAGHVFDPWRAWTVVPRRTFGLSTHVSRVAVDGRTLANDTRTAFVVQQSPPRVAVPRTGVSSARGNSRPRGVGLNPDPSGGPRSRQGDARVIGVERLGTTPRAGQPSRAGGTDTRSRSVVIGSVPASSWRPTRIETGPALPYPVYVPHGPREIASPYDRAARVAAERGPGRARQPLPPAPAMPADVSGSPYPPRFRSAVPEPFRPIRPTSSPFGPPLSSGSSVHEYRSAVPRSGAGVVIGSPAGSRPLPYPAPYAPTIVTPRAPAAPPPSRPDGRAGSGGGEGRSSRGTGPPVRR